jgi:ATP-dependent Clp protease protease subunit
MSFERWIDIKNTSDERAEISIYGPITDEKWFDEEVTPSDFRKKMYAVKDAKYIDLYVNSSGGGVFAGQTIYNMIKRHPAKVTAHVDGIAASIASVVLMAGDEIVVPKNAMVMIHRATALAIGDAEEMLSMASALERVENTIVNVYNERTGLDEKKIRDLMAAETWMNANEALEYGFADKVDSEKTIEARVRGNTAIINGKEIDITQYRSFPRDRMENDEPKKVVVDYGKYERQITKNEIIIERSQK